MNKHIFTRIVVVVSILFNYAFAQNVGIGEQNPGSKLSVKGGLSVGTSYSSLTAPTGGLIIEGTMGVGTSSPDTNAILDLTSTSKGIKFPTVSAANRAAIVNPSKGLMLFDTDSGSIYYHNGTSWQGLVNTTQVTNLVTNLTSNLLSGLGLGSGSGSTWYTGSGAPSILLGNVNDFYLNSSNGTYYEKTTVITWVSEGSILGPAGAAGSAGAKGATGGTGPTGAAGSAGAKGATGGTGPTGATGAAGSNGSNGATGAAGSNGSNGATGAQGIQGIAGPTGATGAAGSNGSNGATGAAGAAGSNGSNGATGAQGIQGVAGPTGAAGSNGSNGATGATGAQGIQGIAGPTGAAGSNGSNGATGATGSTGLLSSGGTTGNTPYWNGSSWVTNSSNIYNNGSNIGIANSAPNYQLDIAGTGVVNISGSSAPSVLYLDAHNSQTNIAKINFTNSSGTGDFQIGASGGDIIWQGGGGRNLQMGAYHGIDISGGRTTTSAITFLNGTGSSYNTRFLNTNDETGIIVQANGTQTANLQEWRNSSGTALSAISPAGSLGIGTSSPTSPLSVGSSSQFQVNSSGNIIEINNVTTSFPSSQGAASSYLKNDGSGNLSWATGAMGATGATGATGSNGSNGTTGVTGPTGANGANGSNGDQYATTSTTSVAIGTGSKSLTVGAGLAYTPGEPVIIANSGSAYMTGTVTTYTSGSGAMVANITATSGSGTFTSWSVNLYQIAGPAGAAGAAGATGATGAAGSQGIQGITGATGATGAAGSQGIQGVAGATGANGTAGAAGATGATGAGYMATSTSSIAIGTGSKTFTTQAGLAYLANERARVSNSSTEYVEGMVTSYSGTSLVINADYSVGSGTYTSWNIGLAGNIGSTGATGAAGATGATGAAGSQGIQGVAGPTGAAGSNGSAGTAGAAGATGPTGATGTNGTNGDKYSTTSTTSVAIGTGSKSLTVGTGLAYTPGQPVIIAYTSSDYMTGTVTTYTSGTGAMTANITSTTGSGTYTSWAINLYGLAGAVGATGLTGATGAAGSVGNNGATGAAGPTGATGATGAAGSTNGWLLTGNSATASNFIGTTSNNSLYFRTDNSQRMEIDSVGDVGIGTTSFTRRLNLVSPNSTQGLVMVQNTSASGYSSFDFMDNSGTMQCNVGFANPSASSYANNMYLATNTTTASIVFATQNIEAMRVSPSGNIGIGTTTPAYTLDVNGTGNFDGALTIGAITLPNTDGTSGQVLTTDGSGDVSWGTPSASPTLTSGNISVSSGTNNNVSIGSSTFIRLTGPSSSFTITGLTGGVAGKMIVIYNTTSENMTIANNSSSSSSANRILTLTGANVVSSGTGAATFVYDGTQGLWIMISVSQ